MSATQERQADQERAIQSLRSYIPTRRTIIHTRTDYTRSMTDYVRLYVVSDGAIVDITYFVARARGRRMTDRGIAYSGGGYSKGLEAADDAWRARFGETLRQSQWREIS